MRRIRYKTLIIICLIVGVFGASISVREFSLFGLDRGRDDSILGLQMGLDLQGGVHLVYEAYTEDGGDPTSDDLEAVMATIRRRVDAFGVTEPVIQRLGSNRILLQLPGVTDVAEAKNLIGQTAQLKFMERRCLDVPCDPPDTAEDKDTGLEGDDLSRAFADTHPTTGQPVVSFQFKGGSATRTFADLTTRLAQSCTEERLQAGTCDRTAILLDNGLLIAPISQTPILTGSGFIEGPGFTVKRTQTLAIQLESGRLRVPIRVVQERDVAATLGEESLRQSLIAGTVGLALVLIFMVAYYRVPGVVAAISLVMYSVIVLGVFKLVPVTLTLAGVAAFVLSLGMAVDANVLIFERIKEELRMGRTLLSALNIGFNRAWPAIRDSNVSTFIICGILFWFGSQFASTQIQGFALTLFIGVATSMFTAYVVTRTLLSVAVVLPIISRYRSLFSPERVRPSSLGRSVSGGKLMGQGR